MKATVEQLQAAIARERAYQDTKWGSVWDNPHSLAGWLLIAERELDEAIEAWIRKPGDKEAKAELLQMVAVGDAWLEQIGGNRGIGKGWEGENVMPFEEWLICAKDAFASAKRRIAVGRRHDEASGAFRAALGAGMMGLIQHGIVERDELEEGPDAPHCRLCYLPLDAASVCADCAYSYARGDL